MAELTNRMALQGVNQKAQKIMVSVDSNQVSEPGTSNATIYSNAPDGTRMWIGQRCEITPVSGKLRIECTPSPETSSPIAAVTYREAAPSSDGSCNYECIAGCNDDAPVTLHSTTPIVFAPLPPRKVDLVLQSCAILNEFNGSAQHWPSYGEANAMLLATFADDRQAMLEKLPKIWKKTVAACRKDPHGPLIGKLMESAGKYATHPPR